MVATNIQTPAARATDPKSSHIAAAEMNKTGKRQTHIKQLAEVVASNPGKTSAELAFIVADAHPHLTRHEVARRLPDGEGQVFTRGEARKCTQTNRLCITWWPTEAAKAEYCIDGGIQKQ
ncbi:MAG: hypothetical protein MK185_06695 [Saccharospirillaceae bacterium]|nr:hypothetical protein [Saccharospirillaceae bacterium]